MGTLVFLYYHLIFPIFICEQYTIVLDCMSINERVKRTTVINVTIPVNNTDKPELDVRSIDNTRVRKKDMVYENENAENE